MPNELSFTTILENAAKLPLVRIERNAFLSSNLSRVCTKEQIACAIENGTLQAGIPVATLDKVAFDIINAETLKVTAISTAAGIPGGFAMAATIPADLLQFYGFIVRIAQELAYIYGWTEMFSDNTELDAGTESQLIVFIGVMSGVGTANKVITKLFGETAMRVVAKRVAAKALTKTWYYPLVKKIAAMLGQKVVKATFAKGVSKAIPIIGGVVSGGLTLATFRPMACNLQNHLSKLAHMTPDEYIEYESSVVIESDNSEQRDNPSCPDVDETSVDG